jgi:hypothetical protein
MSETKAAEARRWLTLHPHDVAKNASRPAHETSADTMILHTAIVYILQSTQGLTGQYMTLST